MSLTYEEGIKALSEFQDAYPWVTLPGMAHSVSVLWRDDELVIELVIDSDTERAELGDLPETFGVTAGLRSLELKVVVVSGRRGLPSGVTPLKDVGGDGPDARPVLTDDLVRAGNSARGEGMPGAGTAGWIIYLDTGDGQDHLLCMSNWHVLCARGNASDAGVQRCRLKGRDVSTLFSFEPISGTNRWDLAFAELDSPSVAVPEFEACSDGNTYPYPASLTDPSKVIFGSAVHKVGNRTGCTSGRLVGVGNTEVNGQGWFVNQLVFNRDLWAAGDSGSVVVLSEDNSVLGLVMSSNGRSCFGNPIYQAPWSLRGLRHVGAGRYFPEFTGAPSFSKYTVLNGRPPVPMLFEPDDEEERREEQFPTLGARYVCGVVRSPHQPDFDGTVEFLGNDFVGRNHGDNVIGVWLLSGPRSAPNARRIRSVRHIDAPLTGPGHYRPGPNEICFHTVGRGGFGTTVIGTCPVDDLSGAVCQGVGVRIEGRGWTIGPPPRLNLRQQSIMVADYPARRFGRNTGFDRIQRFLFIGFPQ